MTGKKFLFLSLPNGQNEYQQLVKADATRAAVEAGLDIEVAFSDGRVMTQVRQLYGALHGEGVRRADAIAVMPVLQDSLGRFARDAARAGMALVFLHRRPSSLDEIRSEFPSVSVSLVSPDQLEIGRIQGRQAKALLPRGGLVLCVQGNAASSPAEARLQGMREVLAGSNIRELAVVDGNWTASDAERVMADWLRLMSTVEGPNLIVCQNDDMAVGALRALESRAATLKRPQLAAISLIGCDGLETLGKRLVGEGRLKATVVVPSSGRHAVEILALALAKRPTPVEIVLSSAPYPEELAPLSP